MPDTTENSVEKAIETDEATKPGSKDNRKNFRFDDLTIRALETLKGACGIQNETSVTSLAIQYTARHIPLTLAVKGQELRKMQPSVLGVAAILCAFFREAERVMQEAGASEDERQFYGLQFLLDLGDPFATASLLLEIIEDRPVWLRHNWQAHYQYNQGKDILERALGDLDERYSSLPSSSRLDGEDRELYDDLQGDDNIETQHTLSNYDAEGDGDELSIRLYPEDIYSLYEEAHIVAHEKEDVFFFALSQSVATLLPHIKKGSKKV